MKHFSCQRRQAIKSIAAISLLGVGGCACWIRRPDVEIVGDVPANLKNVLKPAVLQKDKGAPPYVIDVHAHFFSPP